MLTQKLLRLDEATIQEVEELAQKLSKTEYTSFSALVRQLIRTGLDYMKKEKIIKEQEAEINRLESALEIAVEALKKIAVREEEELEESCDTHTLYRPHIRGVNGLSNPYRDEAEILYVIQSREYGVGEKQYLTIDGFNSDQPYNSVE